MVTSVYLHFVSNHDPQCLCLLKAIGLMRWEDEGYLMYFFHSKLLFIPVLWKERRRGGRRENGETSEEGTEEKEE